MKKIIILLQLIVHYSYAQSKLEGKINGFIKDETDKPIEFAIIQLKKLPDSTLIASKESTISGNFNFENLPYSTYLITASQTGKETKYTTVNLNTALAEVSINLATINLQINEVSITAQRSLVRQDNGKIIVDVENSLSNSGLTAVDVLRKAPGVEVDNDGKISIKGKTGVQIMIDDKVMYMSNEQISTLLKTIPSDQLKEIEISSISTAKNDALGMAGIINIKLKKGLQKGFHGSINMSAGSGVFHKSSIGTNMNYKKEKGNINFGYQYSNRDNLADIYENRIDSDPKLATARLNTIAYFRMPEETHNLAIGGDYNIKPKLNIHFSTNTNLGVYKWDGYNKAAFLKSDNSIKQRYYGSDNGIARNKTINASVGFTQKLDTNGTELSGSSTFNHFLSTENKHFDMQYYDSADVNNNNPFLFLMNMRNNASSFTSRIDFVKIINKIKLESGLKTNQLNDFKPINVAITENFKPIDGSNHFRYIEKIYAAYIMSNAEFGKWNLQGGLRLENTQVKGVLSLQDSTFNRNYTNLFPSGNITYKKSDKTSYSLSFARNITRPSGDQLNPVLNIVSPFTAWGGDPFLLPEISNNSELSYSVFGGTLISSVGYSYIYQPILWVQKIDKVSNRAIGGQRNLEFQENISFSMALNLPIKKWWTSSNSLVVSNNRFVGMTDFGRLDNQQIAGGVKSTQSFLLPNTYSLEISGLYDSPSRYAYAIGIEKWSLSIALQRKILANKGSIKLAVNDMFWKFQYGGKNQMGGTTINSSYRWDNRTIMLSLTYKLGKTARLTD